MTYERLVNKNTPKLPPFLFSSIPNKYTSDIYLNFILLKCKDIESDVIKFKSGQQAMLRRIRKRCTTLGINNLNRGKYKVRMRPKELKMAYIFEFVKR
jgi:hypothetical protein